MKNIFDDFHMFFRKVGLKYKKELKIKGMVEMAHMM